LASMTPMANNGDDDLIAALDPSSDRGEAI
jgi:hypothetical protein